MTTLREAAQQALEALEGGADSWERVGPAIDALKEALVEDAMQKFTDVNQELEAALAEPVQEPVAWIDDSGHPKHLSHLQSATERRLYGPLRPLYTAPPKPLTEEEIMQCFADAGAIVEGQLWVKVARAIERAHGIV